MPNVYTGIKRKSLVHSRLQPELMFCSFFVVVIFTESIDGHGHTTHVWFCILAVCNCPTTTAYIERTIIRSVARSVGLLSVCLRVSREIN